MRNPKSDYYTELCKKHSVYCRQAQDASTQEADLQYYSGYYATYFSTYFTHYYGGTMSDAITEEYLAKQGRSDRLYGSGLGDDQFNGGQYSNAEMPVGASELHKSAQKEGSIQGVIGPKREAHSEHKSKHSSASEDIEDIKEGKRSDSIQSVSKRRQQ